MMNFYLQKVRSRKTLKMDIQVWNRIHTKMSWIPNTAGYVVKWKERSGTRSAFE
jgi:hypothetical protein